MSRVNLVIQNSYNRMSELGGSCDSLLTHSIFQFVMQNLHYFLLKSELVRDDQRCCESRRGARCALLGNLRRYLEVLLGVVGGQVRNEHQLQGQGEECV